MFTYFINIYHFLFRKNRIPKESPFKKTAINGRYLLSKIPEMKKDFEIFKIPIVSISHTKLYSSKNLPGKYLLNIVLFIIDFFKNYTGNKEKLKEEFYMNDDGVVQDFEYFKTPEKYKKNNNNVESEDYPGKDSDKARIKSRMTDHNGKVTTSEPSWDLDEDKTSGQRSDQKGLFKSQSAKNKKIYYDDEKIVETINSSYV